MVLYQYTLQRYLFFAKKADFSKKRSNTLPATKKMCHTIVYLTPPPPALYHTPICQVSFPPICSALSVATFACISISFPPSVSSFSSCPLWAFSTLDSPREKDLTITSLPSYRHWPTLSFICRTVFSSPCAPKAFKSAETCQCPFGLNSRLRNATEPEESVHLNCIRRTAKYIVFRVSYGYHTRKKRVVWNTNVMFVYYNCIQPNGCLILQQLLQTFAEIIAIFSQKQFDQSNQLYQH